MRVLSRIQSSLVSSLVLFSCLLVVNAYPVDLEPLSHTPRVRDVWQFPNETWVENIAVRHNGQLLVTLITTPDLYQVSPFEACEPTLVHRFPDSTSLLGITELETDVFAVVAGNLSLSPITNIPGTFSVWKVDLRSSTKGSSAVVSLITAIPEAGLLNGMTTLNAEAGIVLVADFTSGNIYRLNIHTRAYEVVLRNTLTTPPEGPPTIAIGVNGIHIRNSYLYFSNTFRRLLGRVPIHPDGTAAGAFELVAHTDFGDDFAFDVEGDVYLTQQSTLLKVKPDGSSRIILGSKNSTTIAGDTAAQFGRTRADKGILYVVTDGGMSVPVNGTYIEGGKVVAVDVGSLD